MAETKEPGPQKGEEKPKQSVDESSCSEANTTTGGILGDSDGDTESLNNTMNKPSKEVRRKEPPTENRRERNGRSTDRSQDSNQSTSESKERRRKSRDRREWEEERSKSEKEMKKLRKELDQQRKEKLRAQEDPVTPTIPTTSTQGREEIVEIPTQSREEVADTTQGREEAADTTQRREEVTPVIMEINEDNKHRLSEINMGMLLNDDGTFSMTPQNVTWTTNKEMQLLKEYPFIPTQSEELSAILNHPKPTNLKLRWSFAGEWALVPMETNHEEEQNLKNSRIARVEKYIDTKGIIRRALSYGDEDSKLTIWYNLEDIFLVLPRWKIAQPSMFYNGRKFSKEMRRPEGTKSKARPKGRPQYPEPSDQSPDIQGNGYQRRGGRGGRGRGANHNHSRGGRGGYAARGIGRGRGGPSREDPR